MMCKSWREKYVLAIIKSGPTLASNIEKERRKSRLERGDSLFINKNKKTSSQRVED